MYLEIIALPDSTLSPIAFAGMMPWRIAVDVIPDDPRLPSVEHLREFIAKERHRIYREIGSAPRLALVTRDYAQWCEAASWLEVESVRYSGSEEPSPLEQSAAASLHAAANSEGWGNGVVATVHLHLPLERTNLARPVQMAGLKMCECNSEVSNG